MASTTKQINNSIQSSQKKSSGNRRKSKGSRGSYLSKWLDKTLHHDSGSGPSLDADMYINPHVNWQTGNSQFDPGYDNFRPNVYACMPGHMSLPSYSTHYNPAPPPTDYCYMPSGTKNAQIVRHHLRRHNENKPEELLSAPIDISNQSHYLQPKTFSDSQDYTSLPPIVTSAGDANSNSDVHNNDKDDDSNTRRFSDPCVRGLPDIARPANGEVESASESDSDLSGSQVGGRLLSYLLDQISSLKVVNDRLNKELLETKAELESVRQQQAFFPQSQSTFNNAGVLGGQYSPGFLTDLVREIRDAARMREDAMYSRVRAMVHERTDSGLVSSDIKITEKALEDIKCSIRASEADKRHMMERISKMEEELRNLRVTNGLEQNENRLTNGNVEDAESERIRLRKELAETRRAKQNAEEHAHKLERLVTQMRSKFNGTQIQNGPDSLPSDQEHEPLRIRRTSNSTNNSTNNLANNSTSFLNNSSNNMTSSSTNSFSHNLTNSTNASTMVYGMVTDL